MDQTRGKPVCAHLRVKGTILFMTLHDFDASGRVWYVYGTFGHFCWDFEDVENELPGKMEQKTVEGEEIIQTAAVKLEPGVVVKRKPDVHQVLRRSGRRTLCTMRMVAAWTKRGGSQYAHTSASKDSGRIVDKNRLLIRNTQTHTHEESIVNLGSQWVR